MTKLDFTFATLRRLRHLKGAVPWGKMLVLLALSRGPLRYKEMLLLIADINGPLETAKSEQLIAKRGEHYHITEAGRAIVAEILSPAPVTWPQAEAVANS